MDIAVIELESKIRKIIADDNKRVAVFEYGYDIPSGQTKALHVLSVSTFNEETKEVILMYKTKPEHSKETCLTEVVHYLEIIKPNLSPYTMVWKRKGETTESNKSYFYVNNVQEILDKFFATRKIEEYIIFSIEQKGYS